MISNTRVSPRTCPSQLGFIQIFGDDGGRILNISDSGLSFESFSPLGEARTLQFWFSLNLRDRVEAMGEIVWLDVATKVGGLRFVNPADGVIQHIRRYATGIHPNGDTKKSRLVAETLPSQENAIQPPATAWQFSRPKDFDSTELVSWQKHLEICRRKFIHGLVLGLFVASTIVVAAYRFWLPRPSGAIFAQPSQTVAAPPPGSGETSHSQPSVRPASLAPAAPAPVLLSRVASSAAANNSKSSRQPPPLDLSPKKTGGAVSAQSSAIPPIQDLPKKRVSSQQLWSAVQTGDTDAAVALADRYLQGDGVPANCLQARVLLLVASEKKNAVAIRKLDELDKTGCPADPKQ